MDALVRSKMSDPAEGFLLVFLFIVSAQCVFSCVPQDQTLIKFVSSVKSRVYFGDDYRSDACLL